jgi:flagellar capping protein FliD
MEARMELLTPLVVGVVVVLLTGIQVWLNKGRFDKQDDRTDRLEERVDRLEERMYARFDGVDRRFDSLEERVDRRFEQLTSELAAMRSDLTQIALALGVRARPETG